MDTYVSGPLGVRVNPQRLSLRVKDVNCVALKWCCRISLAKAFFL